MIAKVRSSLGAATFEQEWAAGLQMPIELAIEASAEIHAEPSDPAVVTSKAEQYGLTPREIDVLRLLVDGLSTADIAEKLFISPRTVSTHVASILGKLGVATRSAAVGLALRTGLL